jgi:hypothetical protein
MIARYYNRSPKTKLFIRFLHLPPKYFRQRKSTKRNNPLALRLAEATWKDRAAAFSIFPCGGQGKGGKWRRPGNLKPFLARRG